MRRVSPLTVGNSKPSTVCPTAPISSARFAEYLELDAQNHGMNLRFSFAPYPLVGRPREVLRKYVEGNDPVTGRPIMPQIVEALTRPLSPEEAHPEARPGAPRPRLLKPDKEDSLHQLFLENGWTDGAPIILPTEERVAHMLTGTAADPEESRRTHDGDHPPGETGVHGGEGGRQRGHGAAPVPSTCR